MDKKNCLLGRLDVKAFTLIELLVVVLIIGILAAIALPQYQKAVWKSRNTQLKTLASAVGQAQQMYRLANGAYANSFDELNIDLPLTSTVGDLCGMAAHTDSGRKGTNFEIQVFSSQIHTIAWWTSGPYKCAGFAYDQDGKMWCAERGWHFTGTSGSFCNQLEKGTFSKTDAGSYLYALP